MPLVLFSLSCVYYFLLTSFSRSNLGTDLVLYIRGGIYLKSSYCETLQYKRNIVGLGVPMISFWPQIVYLLKNKGDCTFSEYSKNMIYYIITTNFILIFLLTFLQSTILYNMGYGFKGRQLLMGLLSMRLVIRGLTRVFPNNTNTDLCATRFASFTGAINNFLHGCFQIRDSLKRFFNMVTLKKIAVYQMRKILTVGNLHLAVVTPYQISKMENLVNAEATPLEVLTAFPEATPEEILRVVDNAHQNGVISSNIIEAFTDKIPFLGWFEGLEKTKFYQDKQIARYPELYPEGYVSNEQLYPELFSINEPKIDLPTNEPSQDPVLTKPASNSSNTSGSSNSQSSNTSSSSNSQSSESDTSNSSDTESSTSTDTESSTSTDTDVMLPLAEPNRHLPSGTNNFIPIELTYLVVGGLVIISIGAIIYYLYKKRKGTPPTGSEGAAYHVSSKSVSSESSKASSSTKSEFTIAIIMQTLLYLLIYISLLILLEQHLLSSLCSSTIAFFPFLNRQGLLKLFLSINSRFSTAKVYQGFFGLLALFEVADHPDKYNLLPYEAYIKEVICLIILSSVLLFYFKKAISDQISHLFLYLLKYRFFRKIICYYCYCVLVIKGFFELDHIIVPIFFGLPNALVLLHWLSSGIAAYGDCIVLMLFWYTIGTTLIAWDQLAMRVTAFLDSNPSHPFTRIFYEFLHEKHNSLFTPLIQAGWLPSLGKLSAAGQSALFAGVATMVTGICIAHLNVRYNEHKDKLNAEQADKERQARAEKEDKDRQARAEKEDKDRQAKAEHKKEKRAYQATQVEKQRDHERAHWAAEAIRKEKARQAEEDRKKSSGWFGRK